MSATTLPTQSDFSAILKQDEHFAVEDDKSLGNQINIWFDDLMVQSGMLVSPQMMLALSFCSAFTVGGVILVLQENLLTTALGAGIGALIPVLTAMVMRSRRQSKISDQLPGMIDELARAAKTGRSLEKALVLVANDTQDPLGAELRHCTRKLALGMTVSGALEELPRRTGVIATSVLVTALGVHMETGGDLVRVLERLSQTLRDRIQFQGRLKAATAASRATAILMIILPPAIMLFFVLRDNQYLSVLLDSPWGFRITMAAIGLEIIGAIWVLRVLKTSQKA